MKKLRLSTIKYYTYNKEIGAILGSNIKRNLSIYLCNLIVFFYILSQNELIIVMVVAPFQLVYMSVVEVFEYKRKQSYYLLETKAKKNIQNLNSIFRMFKIIILCVPLIFMFKSIFLIPIVIVEILISFKNSLKYRLCSILLYLVIYVLLLTQIIPS